MVALLDAVDTTDLTLCAGSTLDGVQAAMAEGPIDVVIIRI